MEVYREGRLVGGLYGVRLDGAFFGESMFHTERDASKVALVHLVARLRGRLLLLDTQFVTSHLAQFGAVEVPRRTYKQMLRDAHGAWPNGISGPGAASSRGEEALAAIGA